MKLLRIMKLIAILLTTTCLQVSAYTSAQVSFSLREAGLDKVFAEIEKQTGMPVLFNWPDLTGTKKVTLQFTNATYQQVLQKALEGQPLAYEVKNGGIVVYRKREGKGEKVNVPEVKITLKGVILNKQKKPIAGATVLVKGSSHGTATNEQGEFVLEDLDENATLIVSSVNYQTLEVRVKGRTILTLEMELGSDELKGVTVTYSSGYQEIDNTRATGSYVKIDSALFSRRVSTDIISRLDGVTPGLLFDKRDPSRLNLQIRGLYTLSESISQPLIVIDNFPYEGNITDLNPNDIEDVTILRDAAAASIWGAKAGNGVIVIKTKKGKYNQPARVTLNSNVTFSKKPDLSGLRMIPTSDFIELERNLFDQGLYDPEITDNFMFSPITPVVELLNKAKNNLITEDELNKELDNLRKIDNRKDFEKYFYREQLMQQYSAAISGGARNMNYYFGLGYDKNLSNLVGNEYDRISLRSVTTFQPLKSLQIQMGINYSLANTQTNNPGSYLSPIYSYRDRLLPIYQRITDENGNALSINNKYKGSYLDTVGNGQLMDWKYRPLDELRNTDKTQKSNAFLGTLNLNYQIVKGVAFDLQYQFSRSNVDYRDYYNINTFFARDLINTFTNLNSTEPNIRNPIPVGGILDLRGTIIESHGGRGQVNINQSWGKSNQISAIIGGEIRQVVGKSEGFRSYGYTDKLSDSRIDYVNRYPTLPTGIFTEEIPRINQPFSQRTDRFVSYYFNGSYTLLERYVLSASFRKDASNVFGVKTNEKGRPFWSIGGSWNLSNERFFKIKAIPYLRLRATYGYSGNIDPSVTAKVILSYETAGANTLTNIPFAQLSTAPNPNLRWEKVGTLNTGLDFGLKNDRISGSIEYYRKKSTDVIYDQTMDPTTGIPYAKANSAIIDGNGIDIAIRSKNIIAGNFSWETSLSLSKWIYKVKQFDFETVNEKFFINNGALVIKEGYNPYTISSYKWAGLNPNTGDPQIYVGGKTMAYDTATTWLQSSDIVYHGSNLPKYFGNLLNNFNWKGLSLSTNITYRLGYYLRKPTLSYSELFKFYRGDIEYTKRWTKPGDEKITNVPSLKYPSDDARDQIYAYSDINIIKGDHIRLEDVRLSYTLNKSTIQQLPFERIQVYGYVSNINLLLWRANDQDIDPQFLNGVKLPIAISLGLTVNF